MGLFLGYEKAKVQIDDRLSKIQDNGHFGELKSVNDEVWELKWKCGRRVYFAFIPQNNILTLLGGNKNGQDKISVRRKVSTKNIQSKKVSRKLKPGMEIEVYNPTKALQDEERIGRAIWECLKNGDSEGVVEVIRIHLEACNKTELAKEAKLPKTTLYHSLRRKNPTIRTLAKLVHASV